MTENDLNEAKRFILDLRFSVQCMVELVPQNGSHLRQQLQLMSDGIGRMLDRAERDVESVAKHDIAKAKA